MSTAFNLLSLITHYSLLITHYSSLFDKAVGRSEEIAEKTGRVMRMLAAENLGGVLIGSQHNFAWLTAGGTNGIDTSPEHGGAALVLRAHGESFPLAHPNAKARPLAGENFAGPI